MNDAGMRKDGDAHMVERIFPTISPKTVKNLWTAQFQAHADRIIEALGPASPIDFVKDFAAPFSAECLSANLLSDRTTGRGFQRGLRSNAQHGGL